MQTYGPRVSTKVGPFNVSAPLGGWSNQGNQSQRAPRQTAPATPQRSASQGAVYGQRRPVFSGPVGFLAVLLVVPMIGILCLVAMMLCASAVGVQLPGSMPTTFPSTGIHMVQHGAPTATATPGQVKR